jgi:succinate dehydrogenase hydrophobic anchor subunit
VSEPTLVEATEPRRPPFARRFNPDGNERLTAAVGLVLVVLTLVEIATLLLGLQTFLSVHVFVGLVLLPPVAVKLASTGWRFARYYTRNEAYREKGAPQILMRLLAPILVLATLVLFGSGVAIGLTHGEAQRIARQLHGPSSVVWLIAIGIHVLVYGLRALRSIAADLTARSRAAVTGARLRAAVVAVAVVAGVVIGVATIPMEHDWLHLPGHHHHHDDANRH